MHDQPKVKYVEPDESTKQEQRTALDKFKVVRDAAIQCRSDNNMTREALAITERLLDVNPENYSIWSHRRRVYEHLWATAAKEAAEFAAQPPPPPTATDAPSSESTADDGAAMTAPASAPPVAPPIDPAVLRDTDLKAEIKFSTKVITKDYKCYCAWLHRKWIILTMSPALRLEVVKMENKKCEELLKMDQRNFHAWGYRRWITELLADAGLFSDEKELSFCLGKIEENFSNYSAWHNRALVLNKRLATVSNPESAAVVLAAVEIDVNLVIRAFYVDPQDQSAWFYGEFLVRTIRQLGKSGAPADAVARCESVFLDSCDELIREEPTANWSYWLKLKVLESSTASASGEGLTTLREQLRRLDTMHHRCY